MNLQRVLPSGNQSTRDNLFSGAGEEAVGEVLGGRGGYGSCFPN
jgi:hypothetical protein